MSSERERIEALTAELAAEKAKNRELSIIIDAAGVDMSGLQEALTSVKAQAAATIRAVEELEPFDRLILPG